eukprot:TRINITY_DN9065_c0_g1_i1.p1 TRINITY_DN9065_c0_g1~~TRINITY_DN9065_c0_g1_i1.p1  ORF type:complete len:717 (-),score=128.66 TRINITY_DN9065_c0_g1_i1:126-2276(-)
MFQTHASECINRVAPASPPSGSLTNAHHALHNTAPGATPSTSQTTITPPSPTLGSRNSAPASASKTSSTRLFDVYEVNLKKMRQERLRLEKQIRESEEQLKSIEAEKERVQAQVRSFTRNYFGTVRKRVSNLSPSMFEKGEGDGGGDGTGGNTVENNGTTNKTGTEVQRTPGTSKENITSETPASDGKGKAQTTISPRMWKPVSPRKDEAVSPRSKIGTIGAKDGAKESTTTEMLRDIAVMNKSYKQSVQEFNAYKTQPISPELIASLKGKVRELKQHNDDLKRKLQTSDDEAQFLNTLSEAVKICDQTDTKKDSKKETNKKQPKKDNTARTIAPSPLGVSADKRVSMGNALATYADTTLIDEVNESGEHTKHKIKRTLKRTKHKRKKSLETSADSHSKGKERAEEEPRHEFVPEEDEHVGSLREVGGGEVLYKKYHEIAFEELQLDDAPLGNGAFGVVYKALWRGTEVAVKKLLVLPFNEEEIYNFKREAAFLERYSHHPNIVKFCGISTEFPHYAIITEFMEKGSLRDLLIRNNDLSWKRIVGFAVDAAAGVLHLHCEKIIHRDLALRNLLVGADWRVRLADFGLARMMPTETYAKTRGNIGAVRWLAPEVITGHLYSEKSDTYSFGIVLWELCTKKEPFEDQDNALDVAVGIMYHQLRPQIPTDCNTEYAQLMQDCWKQDPQERPTFVQVHHRLRSILQSASTPTTSNNTMPH